jgi:glycosyltransferase involved in cell wall biosynthesis
MKPALHLPKISVVTPCLNQVRFLEQAIRSVLDQEYPDVEYIVIDGGSTDGSADISRRYADRLAYWVTEPDQGHYDAVNKGFAKATGDVLYWLNGDDMLVPRGLFAVGSIFAEFPEISWISGLPANWDEEGRLIKVAERCPIYASRYMRNGEHDWRVLAGVQQESCFWRRSLWDRAGGRLDTRWSLAGDFELWTRMAQHAELVTVCTVLAANRLHAGQRSARQKDEDFRQMDAICAGLPGRRFLRSRFIQSLARRPGGLVFYRQFFREMGTLLQWEGDPDYRWVRAKHRIL